MDSTSKKNSLDRYFRNQKLCSYSYEYSSKPWIKVDKDKISEDYLYLNIWKPTNMGDNKLPVLVNIYGGSFTYGVGSESKLDGSSMTNKGIIVVTLNYRLNIFAYFTHPKLSIESSNHTSGNYGLMDQQFDLQWIKDNIKEFGGDPDKITIANESAGSISGLCLISSPLSKN